MSNDYYNHGSTPINRSLSQSALIRTEFDNVAAGFAKLPTLTANGYKLPVINSGGTAFTVSGWKIYGGNNDPYSVAYGVGALNLASGVNALQNVAIGWYALGTGVVSSFNNVAVGFKALYVNSTGQSNIAIGAGALAANTTGNSNVAVGDGALPRVVAGFNNTGLGAAVMDQKTSGDRNTAVGSVALYNNVAGSYNTAMGMYAAFTYAGDGITAIGYQAAKVTTGTGNTAIGYNALMTNITGVDCTAVGYEALKLSTGDSNVAIGKYALTANDDGSQNVAIGVSALAANVGGVGNVAVGYGALPVAAFTAFDGIQNVAIGRSALLVLTSGDGNVCLGTNAQALLVGSNNVVLGNSAFNAATGGNHNVVIGRSANDIGAGTGSSNVIVGSLAARNNVASNLVAVGANAMQANTSGTNNVGVGLAAGATVTTGAQNTCLGSGADVSSATASNRTAVGYGASATADNQMMLGNTSVTEVKTAGKYTGGMGTGSGTATMIGAANVNTTAVGNVGAGTDDLMTYSLPANSLSANGKGVRITAWGTNANNANAKTLAVRFGTATLGSIAFNTNNAGRWRVVAEVFRTGGNAQTYNVNISNGLSTSSLLGFVNQCADITETDTAAITIKCTGVGVADNDIVQKGMLIEFIN